MSMRLRLRRLLNLGLLALLAGLPGVMSHAQAPPTGVTTRASLKETLEKGLRARRPEEFQYVARVAELVDQKELPLDLVMSTFQWARQKSKHTNFPLPYFARGLRERAAKLGLQAP